MKINDAGLRLLKTFEGLRLKVYKDAVGIPTVGWGHVTNLPVGTDISMEEAERLLSEDLNKFEDGVDKMCLVPLTGSQFSALVCFAYNVGLGSLKTSTLLKKLNAVDLYGAADEFLKWTKAGGKELPALVKRRQAERELFLSV